MSLTTARAFSASVSAVLAARLRYSMGILSTLQNTPPHGELLTGVADPYASNHGPRAPAAPPRRSEEHTSELQSRENLVCRLLLEKKKKSSYELIGVQKANNNNLYLPIATSSYLGLLVLDTFLGW